MTSESNITKPPPDRHERDRQAVRALLSSADDLVAFLPPERIAQVDVSARRLVLLLREATADVRARGRR
jgi:hypothetical protein